MQDKFGNQHVIHRRKTNANLLDEGIVIVVVPSNCEKDCDKWKLDISDLRLKEKKVRIDKSQKNREIGRDVSCMHLEIVE